MRYTLVDLHTFEFSVVPILNEHVIAACRAGRMGVVDMIRRRELRSDGIWVRLRE